MSDFFSNLFNGDLFKSDEEAKTPVVAPEPPRPAPTGIFTSSQKGVDLIKKWEGIMDGDPTTVPLDPYLCPANYWTIGWGHVVRDADGNMLKGRSTKNLAYSIYPGGITRAEAEILLRDDLKTFEATVNRLIKPAVVATSQNQFDAMVSLCFNIGGGNYGKSSVLRFHNANARSSNSSKETAIQQIVRQQRSPANAADAFLLWNKATVNGALKTLEGLVNRRADERTLYLDGTL